MAKEKSKKINSKMIIALIAIVVVIVAVIGICKFVRKDNNKQESGSIANDDYNARLQAIQNKIDDEEAAIQKMNDELAPLVSERSELEQELLNISTPVPPAMDSIDSENQPADGENGEVGAPEEDNNAEVQE